MLVQAFVIVYRNEINQWLVSYSLFNVIQLNISIVIIIPVVCIIALSWFFIYKTRCIIALSWCFAALPCWFDSIGPALMAGKRVLIAAHGNSLRALVKHLDNMSEDAVLELNIPTGVPLVYTLDDNLRPIKHEYLMDAEELKAKLAAVAAQGKAK